METENRHSGNRCFGALLRPIALALLLTLSGGCALAADTVTAADEYPLKAVFLFKVLKFVEWPPEAFSATNAPLVVGVVGEDPFGSVLEKTFQGETVQKRPVVIRRLSLTDDARSCHVLFISRSEQERLGALLDRLGNSPVLTVGDTAGFAERGTMSNLVLVSDSIKLEINLAAAQQAGLQISSKLLSLDRVLKVKSKRSPPAS